MSGLMLSNADTCGLVISNSSHELQQINGCRDDLPLIDNGTSPTFKKTILAARIYHGSGDGFTPWSCNGKCTDWPAETRSSFGETKGAMLPMGSVIVNPGCTMYVFSGYNYRGGFITFEAGVHPLVKQTNKQTNYLYACYTITPSPLGNAVACAKSVMFTCVQVFPTCTPSSAWHTVATLDNQHSTVASQFSYTKTIGTKFSTAITNSFGVSVTAKSTFEAGFFDLFAAKTSLSLTIKYDWSRLDTEEKSTDTSYNVEVTLPAGLKVHIEEVVGTCGGSTIQTQMFRVVDSKKNQTLITYQGKMKSYSLV